MRYFGLRHKTYLVRATVLLLAVSPLIGCARWYTPAATPMEILRREPERVRVHTAAGQELILDDPRIAGDSVEGRRVYEDGGADSLVTVHVALEEVYSVSVWVGPPDTGASVAYLAVGVVAVMMTALIVFVPGAVGGT